MTHRYFVHAEEVIPYSPSNHTGTINRRLIGPDTVGATSVEVVLGIIEKDQGASAHAHPGIEQVCYLLEGQAVAEIGGQRQEMNPGDCCFFPADEPHSFAAISDTPVKVLVIYSPPYREDPSKVIRTD